MFSIDIRSEKTSVKVAVVQHICQNLLQTECISMWKTRFSLVHSCTVLCVLAHLCFKCTTVNSDVLLCSRMGCLHCTWPHRGITWTVSSFSSSITCPWMTSPMTTWLPYMWLPTVAITKSPRFSWTRKLTPMPKPWWVAQPTNPAYVVLLTTGFLCMWRDCLWGDTRGRSNEINCTFFGQLFQVSSSEVYKTYFWHQAGWWG